MNAGNGYGFVSSKSFNLTDPYGLNQRAGAGPDPATGTPGWTPSQLDSPGSPCTYFGSGSHGSIPSGQSWPGGFPIPSSAPNPVPVNWYDSFIAGGKYYRYSHDEYYLLGSWSAWSSSGGTWTYGAHSATFNQSWSRTWTGLLTRFEVWYVIGLGSIDVVYIFAGSASATFTQHQTVSYTWWGIPLWGIPKWWTDIKGRRLSDIQGASLMSTLSNMMSRGDLPFEEEPPSSSRKNVTGTWR